MTIGATGDRRITAATAEDSLPSLDRLEAYKLTHGYVILAPGIK
jgi:hypothetical protein